jgi:multiple sugar transport system substrate-binding protein
MIQLKKLYCFILIFLFVATISFAGGDKKEEGPITITWWRYVEENQKEKELTIEYANKYSEENPDVTVEVVFVPWEQFVGEKVIAAIATGEGPDYFWIAYQDLLKFVEVLYPLDDYLSEEIRPDYLPGELEAGTIDGKLIALPNEGEHMGVFYDKRAFREAGITKTPETWEELIETAKKLTTPDRYGFVVETKRDGYQVFTWWPFFWQGGGRIMDDEWKESLFYSQAAIDALELWGDLVNKYKVSPTTTKDITWMCDEFVSGMGAMWLNGTWAIATMWDYPDFEYGVFPYPVKKGGKRVLTPHGGWWSGINKHSENAHEAAEFLFWLRANKTPTFNYKWSFEANIKIPVRKSTIEMGSEKAKDVPELQYFLENISPYVQADPIIPPQLQEPVLDAIQGVMHGGLTAEEAAKRAHDQINEFLATYDGPITGKF